MEIELRGGALKASGPQQRKRSLVGGVLVRDFGGARACWNFRIHFAAGVPGSRGLLLVDRAVVPGPAAVRGSSVSRESLPLHRHIARCRPFDFVAVKLVFLSSAVTWGCAAVSFKSGGR
jgi:hypothetical protein